MVTWGVLRLPVASPVASGAGRARSAGGVGGGVGGDGALAAGLAAHLDGALAVAGDAPLSDVLAVIPSHVTRLVELDATLTDDAETLAMLARLLGEDAAGADGPCAAVVAARPLADALKRVAGDVVVSGLERDGLMIPCLPFVLDRAALAAAVAAAVGNGPESAVGLLLAAGGAVRVVPVDGAPLTVRSAPDVTSGGSSDVPNGGVGA